MDTSFIKLFNMSIAASWLILAVIVLRILLKRAPKAVRCVLWALVAIRLICPFSFESVFSLIPSAETVNVANFQAPVINSGIPYINSTVNPAINEALAPKPAASADPMQIISFIVSIIWIAGIFGMALYAIISFSKLHKRVSEGVVLKDNIWLCDRIDTPFILGVIRPRIYLPSSMNQEQIDYVVAHEKAHLKRRDHIWKPLGFVLLAVYWFNPLCWVAYRLLCKDIELACDEKVIKDFEVHMKKAYSETLLACSVTRRAITACPLAFGEVGIKERIKSILNYRKPAFWIITAAVAVCIAVAVCFLTNPVKKPSDRWLRSEAWPLAKSCAMVNDVTISEKNPTILRHKDDKGIDVSYAIIDDKKVRTIKVSFSFDEATGEWSAMPTSAVIMLDSEQSSGSVDRDQAVTYIADTCIYINPLSSTVYPNGDDKRSYIIGKSSDGNINVSIIDKMNGEIASLASMPNVEWQALSNEKWKSLFTAGITSNIPDISNISEPKLMELGGGNYLFDMDGQLWIGNYRDEKVGMWSIFRLTPENKLTINDVIALSKKGKALSWQDFDKFYYVETGFGLYIRVYDINSKFSLWIGGGITDNEPMYISLKSNTDPEDYIDIRTEDVSSFINKHQGDLLDDAISKAILARYGSDTSDGLIHVESHVLLADEGASSHAGKTPDKVTAYLLVMYQSYSSYGYPEQALHKEGGGLIPTALTFKVDTSGNYVLTEYWEPRDGSYYVPDIRAKFPKGAAENAIDTQKYVKQQIQECEKKAQAYLDVNGSVDKEIAGLLSTIEASPALSSAPGDYIKEHRKEYDTLVRYGEYTLSYCFAEFLKGDQTDLHGQIMAIVCRDAIAKLGEAIAEDSLQSTGQDWFDSFRRNAEGLQQQYESEELEKHYPATWLLLKMIPAKAF